MTSSPSAYYCAGAIRGDAKFSNYVGRIINIVSRYGEPYSERSSSYKPLSHYTDEVARSAAEKRIYERDLKWLGKARAVIAEISGPSTGTGREIEKAVNMKKPVFCLYNEISLPSLMVTQDPSRYLIVQKYSGEKDLEAYLTCFLEIASRCIYAPEISRVYHILSKEVAETNFGISRIGQRAQDLLKPAPFDAELSLTKRDPSFESTGPDFRDMSFMISFMFKNIILQARWDRLKSQRIGQTFISGDKHHIISALVHSSAIDSQYSLDRRGTEDSDPPRYPFIDIGNVHLHLQKFGVTYNRWALTKNLRAYRRIGLLLPVGETKQGGTKFKDQIEFLTDFEGDTKLSSHRSRREFMSPEARITWHLRNVSMFLEKYGQSVLLPPLLGAGQKRWYSRLLGIPTIEGQTNIDDLTINDLLRYDWAIELVKDLRDISISVWNQSYSSFTSQSNKDTRKLGA